MRRRARRRVRALAVLVALAAVIAGILTRERRVERATLSDVITRPAPELGPGAQLLLPGQQNSRVVVPDRPHAPEELPQNGGTTPIQRTRTFLVNTSSLGLRGPEPAPGGPRVLAVGDSVTFGWGLADEESWPARLSAELGVTVLNGGVPAQKPGAIARWTADNAQKLGASLVLFARRPDPREADPVGAYASAIAGLRAAIPGIPIGVILAPVSTLDPEGLSRGPAEATALAAALAPLPVLDLTPAFRAAAPDSGVTLELSPGHQRLLRLPERSLVLDAPAPEHGLAAEIRAAFEQDNTLVEPLFFDGGHPDAEGMKVFAREVARWVRAQGWLAQAPPPTTGEAPVIPAHQDSWERDPPEFVSDPAFYGEASWDDVRGRVIQHQATVWRDRARLRAMAGDLAGCAEIYDQGVAALEKHPAKTGVGAALYTRYLDALRRDAALARALAEGRSPPLPAGGLARLRARMLAGADQETLRSEAKTLDLPPLDRSGWADFQDRHALRLALVDAALDAADPFALPDLWGPWDPALRQATADAIIAAAAGPTDLPPHQRAARHMPSLTAHFSVEGLGDLPTGDTWIDTAGEPGPAAIGRLEVLSLDDPQQRARLEKAAAELQAALDRDPRGVADALAPLLAFYAGTPYTSAYYNEKAARDEVIRQLARARAWLVAATLIDAQFPLHRQDFACPNRAGILRGIQGRLLGLAGARSADLTMRHALIEGERFLARIDAADRR